MLYFKRCGRARFFCSSLYFLKKLRRSTTTKSKCNWSKGLISKTKKQGAIPGLHLQSDRRSMKTEGSQAAGYYCLLSSIFEQPGFPKSCLDTSLIAVDKWRWSPLWEVSQPYWAAAQKHAGNCAGAQIPQRAFPSSPSCHAWKHRVLLPGVRISAQVIFFRGQKGITPGNYTPELWRTVMHYAGKGQQGSFLQQNTGSIQSYP